MSITRTIGESDYEIGTEVEESNSITGVTSSLSENLGINLVSLRVLSRFEDLKWNKYDFDEIPNEGQSF